MMGTVALLVREVKQNGLKYLAVILAIAFFTIVL